MEITFLAADSFGTRSMAAYIETKDCKILIDPGVALGPSRYNKPPHAREINRLEEHWEKIKRYAKKADVLIVTHYHYDHHNPEEPEIYKNKAVFLKHPLENINKSQKVRAAFFLDKLKGFPKTLEYSDRKEFTFGKTKIKFSPAVFHGTNQLLGFVTEVLVDDGKQKFIHTSDVEGPAVKEQAKFILENNPDIAYLDGPLSYMLGFRYSYENLNKSIQNLIEIFKKTKIKTLVIDHHFLRDIHWQERMKKAFDYAKEHKIKMITAAEYNGMEIDMLEANRTKLWKEFPNEKASFKFSLND